MENKLIASAHLAPNTGGGYSVTVKWYVDPQKAARQAHEQIALAVADLLESRQQSRQEDPELGRSEGGFVVA